MKKITNKMKLMLKSEAGQGATEYILLLVIIVGIAMVFGKDIKKAVGDKMSQLSSGIQSIE